MADTEFGCAGQGYQKQNFWEEIKYLEKNRYILHTFFKPRRGIYPLPIDRRMIWLYVYLVNIVYSIFQHVWIFLNNSCRLMFDKLTGFVLKAMAS